MIYRILAFFLAFSFTLPTISNNYSIIPTSYAVTCPEGMEKHPDREGEDACVFSKETLDQNREAMDLREESQNCNSLEGDARAKCLTDIAEREASGVDSKIPEDFNSGWTAGTGVDGGNWGRQAPIQVMNAIFLYYMMTRATVPDTCPSASFWLIMGAGLATIAGELSAGLTYRMKMRGIVKDFKNDIANNTTTSSLTDSTSTPTTTAPDDYENSDDPQYKAFQYLIDQESARRTAAFVRGGTYTVAAGLYLAAAIVATVEATATYATAGSAAPAVICINPEAEAKVVAESGWLAGILGVVGVAGVVAGGVTGGVINSNEDEVREQNIEDANALGNGEESSSEEEESEGEGASDNPQAYNYTPMNLEQKVCSSQTDQGNQSGQPGLNDKTIESIFYEFKNGWIDHVGYDLASNAGFHHPFSEATPAEINEITIRSIVNIVGENVINLVFSSAYASEQSTANKEEFIDENSSGWADAGKELLVPLTYFVGVTGVAAVLGIFKGVNTALSTAFTNPIGRLALGYTLGIYAGFVAGFSYAAAHNAGKRIEEIEKIRDQYAGEDPNGLDPCGASRDDPAKPSCYCYLEDGSKDYSRSNSQTCLVKWGEAGVITPTNYAQQAGGSSAPTGCVTNSGQFDGSCSCRYAKDRNKKCKTISSSMNFGGMGNNSFMQGAIGAANAITNGTMSGADVAAGRMHNSAIKASKLLDKMIKKHPKLKKVRSKIAKTRKKFRDFNNKMLRKAAANISPVNPNASASAAISSPADALKAAKDSVKKESTLKFSGGAGGKGGNGKKEDDMDFDFGMGGDVTPGVNANDLADAMDKEYDYKGDIHNNPHNNIFDILSLRYQRSGLRRLFDDTGSTRADDPAKSDINKK